LDNDFYIVRNDWIASVLGYMKANELTFFGVTYHCQDYAKYRYFPSVVCMFVDLEKISAGTLDFMPQMEFKETGQVIRTEKDRETKKKTLSKKVKRFLPQAASTFFAKVMRTLSMRKRRMVIGTARDTSYRIYTHYGGDVRFLRECVNPVFDPRNEYIKDRVWLPLNRMFEALLPDRLCYVPKDGRSYSRTGFKELGYADVRESGWEEYLWRGVPFGVHIRGSKTWKRNDSEDDEVASIKSMLSSFL